MRLTPLTALGLLAAALALPAPAARADDLLVPRHYPTIQAAIDAAADFDRVLVNDGDWFESLDLHGRPVVVEALQGPGHTRLLPPDGPALVTRDGSVPGAVLRGFTISGGTGLSPAPGAPRAGGAVFARDAWLRVENCHFLFNSATGDGGAVSAVTTDQQVVLDGCLFRGNTAGGAGGGASLVARGPAVVHRVFDTTFRENHAAGDGGGLHVAAPSGTDVSDTLFTGNTSGGDGGGLGGALDARLPSGNVYEGNHAAGRGGALHLRVDTRTAATQPLVLEGDRAVLNSAGGHGGAFAFALSAPAHPGVLLRRAVLAHNSADGEGGALWLELIHAGPGDPAPAPFVPLLERVTLVANRASAGGDAVAAHHALAARLGLTRLVLRDPGPQPLLGTPTQVSDSLVEGGFPGPGNFDADPLFFDPEHHVYALRSASPARGAARDGGDLGGLAYSAWLDHGHALHGASGRARLTGSGATTAGSPVLITLENAAPYGLSALVVGAFAVYAPFKKGIVVPFPHLITPYNALSPDGSKQLALSWPPNVPDEASIYAQWFIMDPSTESEVASSNGLSGTQPAVP